MPEKLLFWMDTLCVPPLDKLAKAKAISRMGQVYLKANQVLVLDEQLLELDISRSPSPTEQFLRLHLSG